ncbi:MAG: hypothetical protein ACRCS9_13995 [Hyphomicrobium sp.]
MSNQILEERVGKLETGQARQEERLGRIETDVAKAATGIEKLLEREARRPEPVSFRHITATLATAAATIAALVTFVWWFVAVSPAVTSLEKRLDHAEWKHGWAAKVDK